MDYESFLSYVQRNILYYLDLDEEVTAEVRKSYKNNGIVLDGLSIHRSGEQMSPNLYLNGYFTDYLNGRALEDIMQDIVRQYRSLNMELNIDPEDIFDFEKVKNQIVLRLVNVERNGKLLEQTPYIPYEDLAITFRWLAGMDEAGIATMLIRNRELESWGICVDELYAIALENTMRLFPPVLRPLGNMLMGYLKDIAEGLTAKELTAEGVDLDGIQDEIVEYMAGERFHPVFYVLTNEQGINGATCMLYPGVIKSFAMSLQHDLYVLPSSIHEVILVPDTEEISAEILHKMVQEANDTIVFDSEILSDNIYYYSRNEKSIKRLYGMLKGCENMD